MAVALCPFWSLCIFMGYAFEFWCMVWKRKMCSFHLHEWNAQIFMLCVRIFNFLKWKKSDQYDFNWAKMYTWNRVKTRWITKQMHLFTVLLDIDIQKQKKNMNWINNKKMEYPPKIIYKPLCLSMEFIIECKQWTARFSRTKYHTLAMKTGNHFFSLTFINHIFLFPFEFIYEIFVVSFANQTIVQNIANSKQ